MIGYRIYLSGNIPFVRLGKHNLYHEQFMKDIVFYLNVNTFGIFDNYSTYIDSKNQLNFIQLVEKMRESVLNFKKNIRFFNVYIVDIILHNLLVEESERRYKEKNAIKIQTAWRNACSNPEFLICRRRLLYEFCSMI
jgi:hypothetical protein